MAPFRHGFKVAPELQRREALQTHYHSAGQLVDSEMMPTGNKGPRISNATEGESIVNREQVGAMGDIGHEKIAFAPIAVSDEIGKEIQVGKTLCITALFTPRGRLFKAFPLQRCDQGLRML